MGFWSRLFGGGDEEKDVEAVEKEVVAAPKPSPAPAKKEYVRVVCGLEGLRRVEEAEDGAWVGLNKAGDECVFVFERDKWEGCSDRTRESVWRDAKRSLECAAAERRRREKVEELEDRFAQDTFVFMGRAGWFEQEATFYEWVEELGCNVLGKCAMFMRFGGGFVVTVKRDEGAWMVRVVNSASGWSMELKECSAEAAMHSAEGILAQMTNTPNP